MMPVPRDCPPARLSGPDADPAGDPAGDLERVLRAKVGGGIASSLDGRRRLNDDDR